METEVICLGRENFKMKLHVLSESSKDAIKLQHRVRFVGMIANSGTSIPCRVLLLWNFNREQSIALLNKIRDDNHYYTLRFFDGIP